MYTTSMLWRMLLSSQHRLKAKDAALKTYNGTTCIYDGVEIVLLDLIIAINTEYEQIEYMSSKIMQQSFNA